MKKLIRSSTSVRASVQYDNSFTYTRSKQKFSVKTKYEDDPDSFQCQVSEIHPYDLAEYAWAKKDAPVSASIFKEGKKLKSIPLPEWDEDIYEDADEYLNEVIDRICVALLHVNASVESRIDHT